VYDLLHALTDNKYFTMSGKKYTNGFSLRLYSNLINSVTSEALFNLDGQYKSVSFTVGHLDDSANVNVKLNIYLDGIIAYTKDVNYDDVAQKVTVPLNGALQMKIEVWSKGGGTIGFSEGKFE